MQNSDLAENKSSPLDAKKSIKRNNPWKNLFH